VFRDPAPGERLSDTVTFAMVASTAKTTLSATYAPPVGTLG
jgi:hypothetical protein